MPERSVHLDDTSKESAPRLEFNGDAYKPMVLVFLNRTMRYGVSSFAGIWCIQDEVGGLIGGLRNDAKAAGIPDTPEAGLEFLISRIKNNLHVALCFSPVGDIFRIRKSRIREVVCVHGVNVCRIMSMCVLRAPFGRPLGRYPYLTRNAFLSD